MATRCKILTDRHKLTNDNLAAAGICDIDWDKLVANVNLGYAVITDPVTGYLTTEQYLAVGRGGTGTGALTEGSVVFAGVGGVYSQDADLFWDAGNGRLGVGTNTPVALFESSVSDLWADQVKVAARFTHHTTVLGGGDAGMGVRADWALTNDAGADTLAGALQSEWSDPAAGSEDSILRFYYMKGGALTEGLNVSLSGITVPALTVDGPVYSASGVLSSEQYLDVTRGGTGVGTLTDHGVLVGSGTGDITALSVGTANYVLVGVNAADPTWALLTNDNVAASGVANVDWNKLAAGTVNAAMRTGAGGYPEVVPVNATAANKFLRQVSSGAPSFEALSAGDIPALSYAPAWSGLTTGSIIYANAATTVSEITSVTAGRFLVSNGAGVVPYYPAAADLTWDETNDRLGIGTSAPATRLHVYDESAVNTAVMDVLTIDRGVTGAGIGYAGVGSGIVLRIENGKVGGGVMTESARLETVMTTVTDGAEETEFNIRRRTAGTMETVVSVGAGGYGNVGVKICPTSGPGELAFTHDSCLSLVQEDVTGNLFLWGEESAAGVMTYWDRVNDYIGILTASPAYPLDVHGVIHNDADIRCGGTLLTVGPAIEVGQLGSGYRTSYIDLTGDSSTYSDFGDRWIRWGGAVAHVNAATDLVHRGTGKFQIVNQEAADMAFLTTNTARMTITSDGKIGIGTAAPPYEFSIAALASATEGFDFAPSLQIMGGRGGTDGSLTVKAEGPGAATGALVSLWGSASAMPNAIRFMKGSTEYGRFSTDGYLGIGINSPTVMLDVEKVSSSKIIHTLQRLSLNCTSGIVGAGTALAFAASDASGNEDDVGIISGSWTTAPGTSEDGVVRINVRRAGTVRDTMALTNVTGGTTLSLFGYGENEESQLVYRTGSYPRFINYAWGTAGATYSIGRYDNAGVYAGNCFEIARATGRVSILNTRAYSSGYALRFYSGSSGEVAYTSSDERLKKNIKSVGSEGDVLKALDQLDGRFFDWIDPIESKEGDNAKKRPRNVGLVAQEVEKVLPEAVCYPTQRDIDEGRIYLGVDYEAVTGWLVSVCKALKAEIDGLKLRK